MTRMTAPDCAAMCNLRGTQGLGKNCTSRESVSPSFVASDQRFSFVISIIDPPLEISEDRCEWHRMTRMTAPDCAAMCNLRGTQGLGKNKLYK